MPKWNKIKRDLEISAGRPASDREMHRAFLEANGLREWSFVSAGFDDIPYILEHGRTHNGYRHLRDGHQPPPYIDHARYYRGMGLPVLVYHPYAIPDSIREEVEAWAKDEGLVAKVYDSGKSWYYPGSTCLVVIAAPGVEVVV